MGIGLHIHLLHKTGRTSHLQYRVAYGFPFRNSNSAIRNTDAVYSYKVRTKLETRDDTKIALYVLAGFQSAFGLFTTIETMRLHGLFYSLLSKISYAWLNIHEK